MASDLSGIATVQGLRDCAQRRVLPCRSAPYLQVRVRRCVTVVPMPTLQPHGRSELQPLAYTDERSGDGKQMYLARGLAPVRPWLAACEVELGGWRDGVWLLGQNELTGFRDAQEVLLPLVQ
jgi:hypothetical protein